MQLPSSWDDVTVKDYIFFTNTDDVLRQIAVLSGLDYGSKEIQGLTPKEVREIKKKLSFLLEFPKTTPKVLYMYGFEYHKKPISTISGWEFRTYDYYTRDLEVLYISELIATCYQRKNEPWESIDLQERADLFLNAKMSYFPLMEWLNFKKMCFEKYPLSEEKTPEQIPENENYLQYAERLERERKERLNNTLNWELITLNLANDNVYEAFKLNSLPVTYLFRMITLRKN